MKQKFYSIYDRNPSVVTVLDYKTKFVDQSEADTVGLHYQLQRYGMDSLLARFEAMKDKFGYADTRVIPDFATLQNRLAKGIEYFNNLPSEIRAKFGHKAENFYEFVETNPQEAVKQGYISTPFAEEFIKQQGSSKVDVEPVTPVTPVEPVSETQSVANDENVSA